ncbi:hypothetical protein GUJ93_ZPchr0005g14482 [Zizania palustris]|uniref:WRKY domain-containing protein n=1 Tax=Zizania palustris TaxID=103762 RepID=A0A8J5W0U6_ZIZPA|nr:hypothetical protein GUJ93_ZPchr0005g14482 [Zizania palustris]
MDEVLSRIGEGFRLAGELMAELPATNDPEYLAARCHAIAHAYGAAARVLENAATGQPPLGSGEAGAGGYVHPQRPPPAPLDLLRMSFPAPEDARSPLLFLGTAGPPPPPNHHHHHQLGRGPHPHQWLGTAPSDAYGAGAGTSSGGPVRRLAPSSSSSRSSPPSPVLPRQGRRRRESGEKNVMVTVVAQPTGNTELPPDDGYTWRKYGQKDILGSRYPRSYYRCTHKNYYGCEAKKKVQRRDEDPFTYEVTYCGGHSCLTSTTPLLTLPTTTGAAAAAASFTSSPTAATTSAAAVLGGRPDLVVAPVVVDPPPPHRLGILNYSWMSSSPTNLGVGLAGEASTCSNNTAAAATDTDYPVLDLADVMFNSGSSGGSTMDDIFSSHDRRDS